MAELRRLAARCDFGTHLVRDRLVCGVKSESIQKRLLSEADLTLAKAVKLRRWKPRPDSEELFALRREGVALGLALARLPLAVVEDRVIAVVSLDTMVPSANSRIPCVTNVARKATDIARA